VRDPKKKWVGGKMEMSAKSAEGEQKAMERGDFPQGKKD